MDGLSAILVSGSGDISDLYGFDGECFVEWGGVKICCESERLEYRTCLLCIIGDE